VILEIGIHDYSLHRPHQEIYNKIGIALSDILKYYLSFNDTYEYPACNLHQMDEQLLEDMIAMVKTKNHSIVD